MRPILLSGVVLLAAVLGLFLRGESCLVPQVAALRAKADFQQALARNVVHRSAGVREDEIVQIQGGPHDLDLLEELAVAVRKQGAHPLVTYRSSTLARRLFEAPAKFDRQPPKAELALAKIVDVLITMESQEEDALAGVPAERVTTVFKAAEDVTPTMLKRNVRMVSIGNQLYPSKARAAAYGVSEDALRKLFEAGLAVDVAKMQATGERVRKVLARGKKLRLVGPGGTDLSMSIEKRPALVSDGVLTPERLKKGGADCTTWLPAGEVYVTPVPGTASGTVVCPLLLWQGKPVKNLTLTYREGKLTGMKADEGLAPLKAAYDAQREGKEKFGVIDIGINPEVRIPAGSKVQSYVAAGLVTATLGGDVWAGGDNKVNFAVDCHLPGCTLTVGDMVVVEKGALVAKGP